MAQTKKVIIVESPTKSKTIKGFLGRNYVLVSSRGHVMDLPKSKLGVDVEKRFEPTYIKIKGKAPVIREIKETCEGAKEIYIASDPDREGEAIAYHIAEILGNGERRVMRALFLEITPEYVKEALKNPVEINLNLVNAHKARRVLDRIVGYYTSPILWKILKGGLSAGRVQSVALRLICEREKEIIDFKPTPYWTGQATFATSRNEVFNGVIHRIDGEIRRINKPEELKKFQDLLKPGVTLKVTSFKTSNPERYPAPPFITSSLQQEASKRFGYPPGKTMRVAQELYEGVKLPVGRIGLITYMRTDSVRVNAKANEELRDFIKGKFGPEYLNPDLRLFKDRKNVQAGHEAIRPTRIPIEPDSIKEHLTPEGYRIYKLIYERFLASQMAPAKYRYREGLLEYQGAQFRADEMKPVFLGFQRATGETIERGYVPDLEVGEPVTLREIAFQEKQTEPLPRYTEASLIKKLEENGIGRPSTYAHIVQTLYERKYVIRESGKIVPTELGTEVYKIVIPRFSNIFEVTFTAKMEEELDLIEAGTKQWQDVIAEFYDPFLVSLNKFKSETDQLRDEHTIKVDKQCPKCGKFMIVRWGRYGKFLACSGFPDCKYAENLDVEKTDKKCPKCGQDLILRHGKFGEFLACSGYPDCKYTENKSHDRPCPICGGNVIILKSRRGRIYRCQACDFSSFYPPTDGQCPVCGKGMIQKKNKKACPVCEKKQPPLTSS